MAEDLEKVHDDDDADIPEDKREEDEGVEAEGEMPQKTLEIERQRKEASKRASIVSVRAARDKGSCVEDICLQMQCRDWRHAADNRDSRSKPQVFQSWSGSEMPKLGRTHCERVELQASPQCISLILVNLNTQAGKEINRETNHNIKYTNIIVTENVKIDFVTRVPQL